MKKYKWITFDCYGTLIDWENGIGNAFEMVARTSGVPFDRNQALKLYARYEAEEELIFRRYRDVLSRVARRVCFDLGVSTVDTGFLVQSLSRWRPFADTNAALERLARHYLLGILSNVDNDLLTETRRHFTVPFELIVTAENVASYKPNVQHFQEARRKIGNGSWLHAAQSFHHDLIPCSRLQIDCAWINRKQEINKDPERVRPVFAGPDLTAFANWLEDIE